MNSYGTKRNNNLKLEEMKINYWCIKKSSNVLSKKVVTILLHLSIKIRTFQNSD